MSGLADNLARQSLIERAGNVFPNPWFDVASQYIPKDMKSTFRWAEYLYMRNETYRSAVNRIVRYPITQFKYISSDSGDEVKQKYKDLFEKHLDLRTFISWVGIDTQVYGNSFISVYLPFDRFLNCPKCSISLIIHRVKYKFQSYEFHSTCKCGYSGVFERVDRPSRDESRVNLIRWNPKDIEINYNPFSGRYDYYWNPNAETIMKVEKGDSLLINDLPWQVILTIKEKKQLKFSHNMIYHLREPSLAGVAIEWGTPSCLPIFAQHYYIALLRRANEAIFLDYILPFRILHPQAQQGGTADPGMFVPMGSFVGRMKAMVARKRRDPLDIQVSPIPIGYQTISGEGKSLNVTEELKQSNEIMLNGLGYPADLYYGSLSIQAMPAALRLFENTWSYLTHGYNRLLQWIADKAQEYFSWDDMEIRLEPVTLADDIEKKQVMLQFAAAQSVAQSTALATYGLDYKEEIEKKIEDARTAMQVEQDAQNLQATEQMLASSQGGAAAPPGGSVFDIMSQADQLARQLLTMPYEMRRAEMQKLSQANKTLYAMVKDMMQKIRDQASTMAGQQFLAGGGVPGIPPAGTQPPAPPMM